MSTHSKLFRSILSAIENAPLTRKELIDAALAKMRVYAKRSGEGVDEAELRGQIGAVLNEMTDTGIVLISKEGLYRPASTKPVLLRAESCEREIVALIGTRPKTKAEIRSSLEKSFGTDKTATVKDDNMLYSFIGQNLKRLVALGVIVLKEGKYSIAPEKEARIEDINGMLSLKADFLTRLHSKGGEFFEHYFMTLLCKYLSKNGKTVTENYVTGGANDGGIDGVVKTVDSLGFKEVIMVQTKNRIESTGETVVRAFYGAVCAMQGSRGIFATSSDFHPGATRLLNSIDNCVGVDGEKLFAMACDCQYGIKKKRGKYIVDNKIL